MSPATALAEPVDAAAPGYDIGSDGSAERGALRIADRVVERIAGYAVTQVDGVVAAPRRVLGRNVGDARPESQAAVSARVDGSAATVEATVAVEWPLSVRSACDRLRQRVRDDIDSMAGVRVAHVDVGVVDLTTPSAQPRRVL